MTLDALIMLCGALVAFLSVAGFPPSVYKPLFFLLGIVVVGLGIVVRRKRGLWETTMRLASRTPKTEARLSEIQPAHEQERTI